MNIDSANVNAALLQAAFSGMGIDFFSDYEHTGKPYVCPASRDGNSPPSIYMEFGYTRSGGLEPESAARGLTDKLAPLVEMLGIAIEQGEGLSGNKYFMLSGEGIDSPKLAEALLEEIRRQLSTRVEIAASRSRCPLEGRG